MALKEVLVVSILSLLAALLAGAENTTCTPVKGNEFCECKGDKFAINLKTILNFPVENIPDTSPSEVGQYTYKFSPCTPIACKTGDTPDGVACQSGGTYVARNTKGANWTVQSLNPLKFQVIYGGGDQAFAPNLIRVAQVQFNFFANTTTSVAMIDNVPVTQAGTRNYVFQVKGNTVTTASAGGGGGTAVGVVGLILMCLFLAAFISYFIVGALVNYYHLGARGSEVIPNVTFWKELPFLIKDGFLFTISPCTKRYGRETYQSL